MKVLDFETCFAIIIWYDDREALPVVHCDSISLHVQFGKVFIWIILLPCSIWNVGYLQQITDILNCGNRSQIITGSKVLVSPSNKSSVFIVVIAQVK